MIVESFSTQPLQTVIPQYLYEQYADDVDLQAFVTTFNSLAQGYLTWFNDPNQGTPMALYTSPNVSGLLLDWVGEGLFNIPRPTLTFHTGFFASVDSMPVNFQAVNNAQGVDGITDDIYRRILTWHLYRGDGRQMSVQWLKKRITRFIYGVNGGDIPDLGDMANISITNSGKVISISVPNTGIGNTFMHLMDEGIFALPFQLTYSVIT